MAQIINTNMASLNAQRNLSTSQMSLATSLQRLSSGLRINSAKDDAAGLAISSRMTSQINGLAQAGRNANDGISMAQTAEGALSQISDNLQRMRELSVQAANGSNSSSDRTAIQSEIGQLQQEINRVSSQTAFNGTNLLNGSLSNAQFQVGANANQTINVAIGSAQASAIGNSALSTGGTAAASFGSVRLSGVTNSFAAGGNSISSAGGVQTLSIYANGITTNVTTAASAGSSVGQAAGSAAALASLVNAQTAVTGVTASASTTAYLKTFSAAGPVSLTVYGAPDAAGAAKPVTVSANMATTTDFAGLAAAFNAQTSTTGISATVDSANNQIVLTQSAGYDIGIKNNSTTVQFVELGSTGAAGSATVASLGGPTNGSVVGGQISFSSTSGYTISSSLGTTNGGLYGNTQAATATNASTLSAVSTVDVTTLTNGVPTGANNAIGVIDAAVNAINSQRAALGAMQNRFQSVVNNLQTSSENLTASRSRIQDTDFAHETAQLTRGQILQQAGTAMLAQANSLPNGVLALLR